MTGLKNAFQIYEVEPVSDGVWIVRGSVLVDLAIGDVLLCRVNDPTQNPNRFEIIGISTYGFEITKINKALTGNLVIEGKGGIALKDIQFLQIASDSL